MLLSIGDRKDLYITVSTCNNNLVSLAALGVFASFWSDAIIRTDRHSQEMQRVLNAVSHASKLSSLNIT